MLAQATNLLTYRRPGWLTSAWLRPGFGPRPPGGGTGPRLAASQPGKLGQGERKDGRPLVVLSSYRPISHFVIARARASRCRLLATFTAIASGRNALFTQDPSLFPPSGGADKRPRDVLHGSGQRWRCKPSFPPFSHVLFGLRSATYAVKQRMDTTDGTPYRGFCFIRRLIATKPRLSPAIAKDCLFSSPPCSPLSPSASASIAIPT